MNTGIVQGGWEFVVAAYALTGTAFLVYGISLWTRLRREQK
ncbi:MAG TPA: hypothetical protein VF618_14115 [Thermoanaerobaculia bacterium]